MSSQLGLVPIEYVGKAPSFSPRKLGAPGLTFEPNEDFGGARVEWVTTRIADELMEQYNVAGREVLKFRADLMSKQQEEALGEVIEKTVQGTVAATVKAIIEEMGLADLPGRVTALESAKPKRGRKPSSDGDSSDAD